MSYKKKIITAEGKDFYYYWAMKILDNEGDPDYCKNIKCPSGLKKELIKQYKERLLRQIDEDLKTKKKKRKSFLEKISKKTWKQIRTIFHKKKYD